MDEVASDISTSEGELELEIVAVGQWVTRTCPWLRFAWKQLSLRVPVAIEISGRYYVYGRRRLAAQVLGKSVLDPKWFKWFPQCSLGHFMKHVPSSGEYLDIEFSSVFDVTEKDLSRL